MPDPVRMTSKPAGPSVRRPWTEGRRFGNGTSAFGRGRFGAGAFELGRGKVQRGLNRDGQERSHLADRSDERRSSDFEGSRYCDAVRRV